MHPGGLQLLPLRGSGAQLALGLLLVATAGGCTLIAGFSSSGAPAADAAVDVADAVADRARDGGVERGDAASESSADAADAATEGGEAGFLLEPVDEVCTGSGWCWLNPLPHGQTILGLWGDGETLWACGEQGLLMQYDSVAGWKQLRPPLVPQPLRALPALFDVWGRSASELYVVGESGIVLRHDGSRWYRELQGTGGGLAAVWGPPGEDAVFAVGAKPGGVAGLALRRAAGTWQELTLPADTPALRGVSGASATDVIAVGDQGAVLRWNGGWHTVATGTAVLHDVWHDGQGVAYAAGQIGEPPMGVVMRIDADDTVVPKPFAGNDALYSVWGGPSEVYAAGADGQIFASPDGYGWVQVPQGVPSPLHVPEPAPLFALHSTPGGPLRVAGGGGLVARRVGAVWERLAPDGPLAVMRGVWSAGEDHALVAGQDQQLLEYDGTSLSEVPLGSIDDVTGFFSVWGTDADTYVVGAQDKVLHRTLASGFRVETGLIGEVNAIWGTGTDDVVYAGGARLFRGTLSGSAWNDEGDAGGTVTQIWGRGTDTPYASVVTTMFAGQLLHRTGESWQPLAASDLLLRGVWGPPNDPDLFVAATTGFIAMPGVMVSHVQRFTGIAFTSVLELSAVPRFGPIWGRGDEAWAAGAGGVLAHFTGNSWGSSAPLPAVAPRDIAGNDAGQLFVVGKAGAVLIRRP